MTLLLGGSLLLIAVSAVALVMGWLNAEETYIWTSIVATAVAAVLLILAFFRSRAKAPVPAGGIENRGAEIDPDILADREERSQQKYARATTRGGGEEDAGAQTQVLEPDSSAPDPSSSDDSGATAGTVATAATVGPPAGANEDSGADGESDSSSAESDSGTAASSTVVAVPKTKKFHRSDCRFASAKKTETMSRTDAEGRGFAPCGTCKP